MPAQAWKKISAGQGAKGPRMHHRARAAVRPLEVTGLGYWLLVRRSLSDPSDLAYYLCHGPAATPLRELVRVAGARWPIEESFQSAECEVGLDHYQVRRYEARYRHLTLDVSWQGCIFMVEANKTAGLGMVDRALTQLRLSGALDHITGVAVGSFDQFAGFQDRGWTIMDTLHDLLDDLGVPISGGLPLGHVDDPVLVPLGVPAVLNADTGQLNVEALVR